MGSTAEASNHSSMNATERRRRLLAGESVAEAIAPAAWSEPGPLLDKIRAGEFATPNVKRWREQLTRIRCDLSDILMSRQVIGRLREIVAANERLQAWNLLHDRMVRWYGGSTLVLMAREVDTGRRTVSLRRLLGDIQRHPEELTLAQFRRLHTGSEQAVPPSDDPFEIDSAHFEGTLLEKTYAKIASPNGQGLDVSIITAEIAELDRVAEKVQQMRHTEYAHRAATGPAFATIELQTIHEFIDVAERLVKKYISVLFYESAQLEPVDQTNWTEILTFPWILPRERDTSIPYAATPELVEKLFSALRPEEQTAVRKRLF
jgi:hypothetical protein